MSPMSRIAVVLGALAAKNDEGATEAAPADAPGQRSRRSLNARQSNQSV